MQFRHLPHFGRRHPAHSLHLRRLVLFLRSNGAHVEVVVSFSVPMFERWYSSLRHVDFRVIFLRYEWVIWEWHDRNVKKRGDILSNIREHHVHVAHIHSWFSSAGMNLNCLFVDFSDVGSIPFMQSRWYALPHRRRWQDMVSVREEIARPQSSHSSPSFGTICSSLT